MTRRPQVSDDRPTPSDPRWDYLPLLPSVSFPKQEEMGSAHPVPRPRAGAEASWCCDLPYQGSSSFHFHFPLKGGVEGLEIPCSGQVRA